MEQRKLEIGAVYQIPVLARHLFDGDGSDRLYVSNTECPVAAAAYEFFQVPFGEIKEYSHALHIGAVKLPHSLYGFRDFAEDMTKAVKLRTTRFTKPEVMDTVIRVITVKMPGNERRSERATQAGDTGPA